MLGVRIAVVIFVVGCGGGGEVPPDAAVPDAGPSHAAFPLVDDLGGPILVSPKVVTITYDGDSQRGFVETMDDTLMTLPWWDAVRAGYCRGQVCVGPGAPGSQIHLAAPAPTSLTDSPTGGSLRTLIQDDLTSGLLPAPDADTIYAFFFPATTSILVDGIAASCTGFGAYHASFEATIAGQPVEVPYVVIPRCADSTDFLSFVMSHELIETATDPVDRDPLLAGNAFSMVTDTVWPIFGGGGEVADLCIWPNGDDYFLSSGGYTVQRSWSNLAAQAGHDPCVPAPAQPYFAVAPVMDAVPLAVGAATTLELDGFADGAVPDWDVAVTDVSADNGGTANAVTFSLDQATAHDGARLQLDLTRNLDGTAYLMIDSTSGTTIHRWPVAITSP